MNFAGNFYFKRSYFWLIYIRRHLRCFTTLFSGLLSLWELETFSFSIYILFGRNWWSRKDLNLFYEVFYKVFYEDFLPHPFPRGASSISLSLIVVTHLAGLALFGLGVDTSFLYFPPRSTS